MMLSALIAAVGLSMLHVLPRPNAIAAEPCRFGSVPRPSYAGAPAEAVSLVRERWPWAIGAAGAPQLRIRRSAGLTAQAYRLSVGDRGVDIESGGPDGTFYALMTLGQLAVPSRRGAQLPCVRIADSPALQWRVLSDDVSRGPLPVRGYFERRIRIAAAYKFNGYSPYMEHVFASPTDPLPALTAAGGGISPEELAHLAAYARRYHVTLIPEQQTFAHMHNTLRLERYATLAEYPHGYLLSPNQPESSAYVSRIIGQELRASGAPPFFHIGSDETATLGEGQTTQYVAQHGGRSAVYEAHITDLAHLVTPARAMVWDDGIEADPSILTHIPRSVVIVNWHYDARDTYMPYIETIARAGFQQMVAPGANNWNEIFPQLEIALPNERRFINEGKSAGVLGAFQTVWHDDGETLYEVTWPAVLYSAAAAWDRDDVDPATFYDDLAASFYARPSVAADLRALARIETTLGGTTDKLFWTDPFAPVAGATLADDALRSARLDAESVMTDLHGAGADPSLRALMFSAERLDALGRRFQIAREVRAYYADAAQRPADAIRDLFWCKYLFWEMRDTDMRLASQLEPVWKFESGDHHYASVHLRYDLDAQNAIRRADAIDRATYLDYVPKKTLPPLDTVLGL